MQRIDLAEVLEEIDAFTGAIRAAQFRTRHEARTNKSKKREGGLEALQTLRARIEKRANA